jgi:iron complex transport system ATP-binding protein
MITVEELHISYDGLQNILSHITFGVKKGTFIGVIGPNGSGKTTLLNALSRILTPSDGVIFVQGRELSSLSQRELARELGVVPQDTNIHFDFRVRDIVLMGRHPYIDRFSRESEENPVCRPVDPRDQRRGAAAGDHCTRPCPAATGAAP